jgi:hypothetical protein
MTSGCIVAEPPQYTDPVRTPPELNVYLATPPLTQVLSVYTPQGPSFTVPIRSEDAGEDLSAIYFRDYNSADQRLLNIQSISASTYNEINRTIASTRLPVGDQDKGCHTVTLVVAHASSFQAKNKLQLDPAKAETDAAIITWWVNFNPPEDALNSLADCPTPVLP